MHTYFELCGDDKAGPPGVDATGLKQPAHTRRDSTPARLLQTYEQHTVMGAGRKTTNVRKVEILRNQKTSCRLRRRPDLRIRMAGEAFLRRGIHVVTQPTKIGDQGRR